MRPILLSLGPYHILAGPVFAGLAAILAFLYIRKQKSYASLNEDNLWVLMAYLTVGTFAGAVLLYVVLYGGGPVRNIGYVLRFRAIQGGTFFGNYWACFLAMALFARKYGKELPRLADLLGCSAMLGLFLFRFGCLQHGCCFGRPTDLPWAMTFHIPYFGLRNTLVGIPIHPAQIYSGLGALAIFLGAHFGVLKRDIWKDAAPGDAFVASTTAYGVFRFAIEFVRGSDYGMLQPFGLTTSQLLAVASIAFAFYLRHRWNRAPAP